MPRKDLGGPYLENLSEDFVCSIRNVLPGKESTLFKFYYNSKVRFQSENATGKVVEKDEADGTKYLEWKFTTSFNRSDNGGVLRCGVDWKTGQYEMIGLKSKLTVHAEVICKYPKILSP